jgi:hypothetical protein
MTMTVNNIVKLLGNTQLKYRRLHFEDYARELAPRPATISNRIQLPSFFRSLFADGVNLAVQSVSGKKFSFWHALLHSIYPNYIELSWYDRKNLVDLFIDELNHDVRSYFQRDPLIIDTNMDYEDVRFHAQLPSDQLIYYLTSKFQINITICDTTRLHFFYAGREFQKTLPMVILYRDDSPTFHTITVDDQLVTGAQRSSLLHGMHRIVPEVNRVLSEHTTKPVKRAEQTQREHEKKIEVYSEVNKLTPEQSFRMEAIPQLNKMRLGELQELAKKYGLNMMKEGKTKMIKKLKKELIVDIMGHLSP